MMANDIDIWERFIAKYPDRFDRVEYDVHVGDAQEIAEYHAEWMQKVVDAITRFRIDVVGWNGNQPTIIEVKPYAGLSALGQLSAYQHFFTRDFPGFPEPSLMLITDSSNPNMETLCKEKGIKLIIV